MICKNGHETDVKPCRTCKREAAERFKAKKQGAPRTKSTGADLCVHCGLEIGIIEACSRFTPVHTGSLMSLCEGQDVNSWPLKSAKFPRIVDAKVG